MVLRNAISSTLPSWTFLRELKLLRIRFPIDLANKIHMRATAQFSDQGLLLYVVRALGLDARGPSPALCEGCGLAATGNKSSKGDDKKGFEGL